SRTTTSRPCPVRASSGSPPTRTTSRCVLVFGKFFRKMATASLRMVIQESRLRTELCGFAQPRLSAQCMGRALQMGYGGRALELLSRFYEDRTGALSDDENIKMLGDDDTEFKRVRDRELENGFLATDKIAVRDPRKMPPLLLRLSERQPLRLHWLGVSYGLTAQLHKFWKRAGYAPVYLRQTTVRSLLMRVSNDLTGEHTCVMLKALSSNGMTIQPSEDWLDLFSQDFRKRFIELLSYQFKTLPSVLALSILEVTYRKRKAHANSLTKADIDRNYSAYDLKRLESYARNMLDYHVILDLIPSIARHHLNGWFGASLSSASGDGAANTGLSVTLSALQSAILLGIGLQRKSVDDLEKEFSLPSSQVLALFAKIVRKVSTFLHGVLESAARSELQGEQGSVGNGGEKEEDEEKEDEDEEEDGEEAGAKARPTKRNARDEVAWDPVSQALDDDLCEAGSEALRAVREKQRELINSLDLSKCVRCSGGGRDEDWEEAAAHAVKGKGSQVISIANPKSSKKRKSSGAAAIAAAELGKQRGKVKLSKKARRT
ncbi:MAG: tRNA binding domain-containing protein, partial [Olpidium bornovanus]